MTVFVIIFCYNFIYLQLLYKTIYSMDFALFMKCIITMVGINIPAISKDDVLKHPRE